MTELYVGLDIDEQIVAHLATPGGAKIAEELDPEFLSDDAAEALTRWREYKDQYGGVIPPDILADEMDWDGEFPEALGEPEYWLNEARTRQLRREGAAAIKRAGAMGKEDPVEAFTWLGKESVRLVELAAPPTRAVRSLGTEGGAEWYRQQTTEAAKGLSWGFKDIDEAVGGLRNGTLNVIVARLKRYKSWLAQKSAMETFYNGKRVTFAPLELPVGEFKTRLNCMIGDVPWSVVGRYVAGPEHVERMEEVEAWMREQANPINIVKPAPGAVTAATLAAEAKRYESDILYVDQLDFMERDRSLPEWVEYGRIATELKQVAMELDIPVVLVVQFNRQATVKKFVDLGAEFVGHADKIPQVLDVLMASFATGRMKDNGIIHYGILESRSATAPRAWEIKVELDDRADFVLSREHDLHADDESDD